MLKRRVVAIEKRIAVLGGTAAKKPRLIFRFGDGTDSSGEKDEARDEKNGLIVFKMPRPSLPDGECVLRFDFGSGEDQIGRVANNADDAADDSHPIEGGKTQK
jgi:hypothetical protein